MKTGSQYQLFRLAAYWLGRAGSLVMLLAASLPASAFNSGTNFTTLASFGTPSFGSVPGLTPRAEMTQGPDGLLYGTTELGGAGGVGAVFRLGPLPFTPSPNALIPFTIASFYGTNGSDPRSPLTLGPDGSFYGTTYAGGTYGEGTVFRVTTNGVLTSLASFDGTNGAKPLGDLVFNTNGNGSYTLYGTTYAGGTNDNGTLFSLDFPAGLTNLDTTNVVFSRLVAFDGPNFGAQPWGGVAMGTDGDLYGTTALGGFYGGGTIFLFQLRTGVQWLGYYSGMNTLYDLAGTDGTNSYAGLVLGADGVTFYGTTFRGGTNNSGTLFSVSLTNQASPTLTTSILWNFGESGSGSNCTARLIQGADYNLYGVTESGGAHNQGTIFTCSTNGAYSTLYSFRGSANGYTPVSGLVQSTNGNFYGVTRQGGTVPNSPGLAYELWGFAPYIVSLEPTNLVLTIVTNTSSTLSVSASGSAPLTYQWRSGSSGLGNGKSFSGVTTSNLVITASKATNNYDFDVLVSNDYGAVTSSVVVVTFADSFGTNPPVMRITSPSLNKALTASTSLLLAEVRGVAEPDTLTTVDAVYYQLNGGAPQSAPITLTRTANWVDWSASVTLSAGTNVFQVYAQDSLGHYSETNTIYLVPGRFVPVAGTYNGLFLGTNGVVNPTNAGFFTATVSTSGSLSGTLKLGLNSFSLSGSFGSSGVANALAKGSKSSLAVSLTLDLTTNSTQRIFGTISDTNGAWQANLAGDLSVFNALNNPCPWTGRFDYALIGTDLPLGFTNLTLPGTNFSIAGVAASNLPAAGSWGAITVSSAGQISFSASLSDGTTFSQSVPLSEHGLWPLYYPLYSGQGLLWGWQSFPANSSDVFKGDVAWIAPPSPKAKYYPAGFTLRATPIGSFYSPPLPQTIENVFGLGATNGATFIAFDGNLPVGITNPIAISPKNQVANLGADLSKLSLSFSTSGGTLSGSFTPVGSKTATSFKGVVFQETLNATGFFLGTNQSGQIWITVP